MSQTRDSTFGMMKYSVFLAVVFQRNQWTLLSESSWGEIYNWEDLDSAGDVFRSDGDAILSEYKRNSSGKKLIRRQITRISFGQSVIISLNLTRNHNFKRVP